MKPSIFVGSSSESLDVPQAVQQQLWEQAYVTTWKELAFAPGNYTLETLITAVERFDFAVFVFAPDDEVTSRGIRAMMPRDNVIFELGLFMGHLGRSRTFILKEMNAGLKNISDLAGLTVIPFESPNDRLPLLTALGPACYAIRKAVRDLRMFDRSGKHLAQVEEDVRQQENRLQGQKEIIDQLVIFSMSQPVYEKLRHIYTCKHARSGEYIYAEEHEGETRREFLFLRDHGYIASASSGYFSPGPHLIGQNIVPLVELTPVGNFYVEQREELQRKLASQSA